MAVLLGVAGLLLASFLVQLAVWRVAFPRSQTRALLVIFAIVPVAAAVLAFAGNHALRVSPPDATRFLLAYIGFALAYAVLYSAIEHRSPALSIISQVAEAGAEGCSTADLQARFAEDDPIADRVRIMLQGAWLCSSDDLITLTPQGKAYAMIFEYAAGIVGLAKGG